jgi:hypothetical protein
MSTKPAKIAITPKYFSGRSDENPYKYLQNFNFIEIANIWPDDHKLKAIPNYLQKTAQLWYLNYVKIRNAEATAMAGSLVSAKITWDEFT